MSTFNLVKEIRELKNQLSYSKKYGFFFGAGTSCALGVPDIAALTKRLEATLEGASLTSFCVIKKDLESTFPNRNINIEDILNQLRQIRSITGEKSEKSYLDIDGESAKKLDDEICKIIYVIISESEKGADLTNTKKFFAWLNMQNRDYSKEVFTSNYDLIFEKSLEENRTPYFDGFVGSYEPFFWQESIEKFVSHGDLTQNWVRLWKVHGSLSWFWKNNEETDSHQIVRLGKIPDIDQIENELVIYPSKEKYDSSKKQPFVAYFDRLKNCLLHGELFFIFSGYSFSDQHINEVVFNSLRQNSRLFVLVFCFRDEEVEGLYKQSSSYLNLTALGPTKGIINGTLGKLEYDKSLLKDNENSSDYWDETSEKLTLGDFNSLANFLVTNSGNRDNIEAIVSGN